MKRAHNMTGHKRAGSCAGIATLRSDRLNWKLIIAMSAMYVAFAVWMIYGFTTMSYQVIAHKEDLMELNKTGALESRAAMSIVETWNPIVASVSITFAIWGILFSALLYLPYNYRR